MHDIRLIQIALRPPFRWFCALPIFRTIEKSYVHLEDQFEAGLSQMPSYFQTVARVLPG